MEAELAWTKIADLLRKDRLPSSNLSKAEVSAISELKSNENIVIAPADKGNAAVIMDREDYTKKARDIIEYHPFERVKRDPTRKLERS